MKVVGIIISFFLTINALCQQKVQGMVVENHTGKGISYVNIVAKNKNYGTMTDSLGHFVIEKKNLNDSSYLIISSLGYYQKVVSLSKLEKQKNIIQLDKKIYTIPEINVYGGNPIYIGIKSKSSGHGFYMGIGTQIALYMSTPKKNQKIDEVGFYIRKQGKPVTKFRIRIYGKDSVKNCPSKDLLNENVFAKGSNGNEWVVINLSKFNIVAPENGFYVSMEWINDGNEYYYNRLGEKLYGQVLGYIKNKNNENSNTWIKNYYLDWRVFPSNKINAMIWTRLLPIDSK